MKGAISNTDRMRGFADALKQFPDVKLVATQPANYQRLQALQVMENIMQTHPQIDGVFAANDAMATGVVEAMAGANRKAFIVGINGSKEAIDLIKAGKMHATGSSDPFMQGCLGMLTTVRALRKMPVKKELMVTPVIIDSANLKQYDVPVESRSCPNWMTLLPTKAGLPFWGSTVNVGVPDHLIIGGGSAGAVLAARLSENPSVRILLIEAGPDTLPGAVPADVADLFPSSSLNPSYFWPGMQAQRVPNGPLHAYPQARVMGGGSSIMGMWALRGVPSDFEAWERAGAEGWGPTDAVKGYRKLENDLDRDNTQTKTAPYTIRRVPHEHWPPFATAMERAALMRGLPSIADINEAPRAGFFPLPLSHGETRSSSASAYLTAEVRRRDNLVIMTDTQVIGLRFDGQRAVGVTARSGADMTDIDAREVILSSGAIHSPAMLMRSGVGPGDELQRHGIAPVAVRAGVGRNLQNHPYLNIAMTLAHGQRMERSLRYFALAGMRISSGLEDCPPADLIVFAIGRVSGRDWGTSLAMVGASVYAPFSRGHVTLNSPAIDVPPAIAFSLMTDPRDAPRMVQATRFAESLLLETAVKDAFNDAFLLPPIMALNQFDQPGVIGSIKANAAALLLNAPAPVSRWILSRMLRPGRWLGNSKHRQPLTDNEILAAVAPMGHVTSTCSIGRPDNPMAVVDKNCRVYGVENLRVVDASIMPSVPSANTNLTTLMVAERASELIASDAR